MKVSLPRSEVKEAVAGFSKIVNGKSHTLPVLGCVRFNLNGAVTAQVTDLDQHLQYRFGAAKAQGEGAFIVPLANLKELAQGKAEEIVEFETGDGTAVSVTNHLGSQVVRMPLTGMDTDEWPVAPTVVPTKPAAGFLDTYRRLVPFACTDSTRYVLNSVYVEVADKGEHPVTMIATDGRRLTLWNTMSLPLPMSVIIPTTKFLSWTGLQGDASIGLRSETQKKETRVLGIALSVGSWFYDVKAIDGQYPNWRQVLPGAYDKANRIVFTDEDVHAVRKILPTFPGSSTPNASIELRKGSDTRLVIAGKGTDDKTETTLELAGGSRFEGKVPAIGVNCYFLLDALEAGFRVFTTTDELCPLRSEDGKGGIHVLMPLKLASTPVKKDAPQPEKGPGKVEAGNTTPGVPQQAPGAPSSATTTETKAPGKSPATEQKEEKGGRKGMTKEGDGNGTTEQGTTLDKVLVAVESAKGKLKEAVASLSEVADAVKLAVKEGKAQAGDLEKARATLQKLQAISL